MGALIVPGTSAEISFCARDENLTLEYLACFGMTDKLYSNFLPFTVEFIDNCLLQWNLLIITIRFS